MLEEKRMTKKHRRWKVLEIGGAPTIDNTVQLYYLCTDGGACVSTHMLGRSGGMLPQKFFLKLGALRSLLRPYLYSSLYLDSMPLEYWA